MSAVAFFLAILLAFMAIFFVAIYDDRGYITMYSWILILIAILFLIIIVLLIKSATKIEKRELSKARVELEIEQAPKRERITQDIEKQWEMLSQLPAIPTSYLDTYILTKFASYLCEREASTWKECIKAWKDDQQRAYVREQLDDINARTREAERAAKFAAWNSLRK